MEEFQTVEAAILLRCAAGAMQSFGDGERMRLIAEDWAAGAAARRCFPASAFALGPGEALIVTGPNGAGQIDAAARHRRAAAASSRARCVLEGGGEDWPSVGGGLPLSRPSQRDEDGADASRKTCASGSVFSARRSSAVEAALETVGLGGIGHLPFGYLSTGQKRRAAIARLLVSHRPLWLLDEPTAGLDTASEADSPR